MSMLSLTAFPYPVATGLASAIEYEYGYDIGVAAAAEFTKSASTGVEFKDIVYEGGTNRGIVINQGGTFTLAPGHYVISYFVKETSTTEVTLDIKNMSTKRVVSNTTVVLPVGTDNLASVSAQHAVGTTTVYGLVPSVQPTGSMTGHITIIKVA